MTLELVLASEAVVPAIFATDVVTGVFLRSLTVFTGVVPFQIGEGFCRCGAAFFLTAKFSLVAVVADLMFRPLPYGFVILVRTYFQTYLLITSRECA